MFQGVKKLLIGILVFIIIGLFIFKAFTWKNNVVVREMDKKETEAVKSENNSKGSILPLPELNQRQMDKMALLERQGYITFEFSSHKVYLKPTFWAQMDSKLKNDMTVSFAIYCAIKNHKDVMDIEVYDKQTGQKIAEYNQLFGYKVF